MADLLEVVLVEALWEAQERMEGPLEEVREVARWEAPEGVAEDLLEAVLAEEPPEELEEVQLEEAQAVVLLEELAEDPRVVVLAEELLEEREGVPPEEARAVVLLEELRNGTLH